MLDRKNKYFLLILLSIFLLTVLFLSDSCVNIDPDYLVEHPLYHYDEGLSEIGKSCNFSCGIISRR